MPIKLRFAGVLLLGCGLLSARVQAETLVEPYGFTTLAGMAGRSGTNDGPRTEARLFGPEHLARDFSGNLSFTDGHSVRRASGTVMTIAGRPNQPSRHEPREYDVPIAEARFQGPTGLAVDRTGNTQTVAFETSEDLRTWETFATAEVGTEPPSMEHYNLGKSKAFFRVRVQTPTIN